MIIVDELKRRPWRFKLACHCASTRPGIIGKTELLNFVSCQLNIKPGYLHCSRRGLVHIDLTEGKRHLAIKRGAKAVTCKEFIRRAVTDGKATTK